MPKKQSNKHNNKRNPRDYLNKRTMEKYKRIQEFKILDELNNDLYRLNNFETCIINELNLQMENLHKQYCEFYKYSY